MTTEPRPEQHEPGLARVEAALRDLRVPAPSTLLPNTLIAAGLADEYAPLSTAIGTVWVAWNGRGVSSLTTARDAEEFEAAFRADHGRPIRRAPGGLPTGLARAIERRLAGDRRVRIKVDLRGRSPFEQAVWLKALQIPRGEVRPYGWIASEIGHPAAVRAVGTALGGPDNKRTLLAWEGADPDELERLARSGIRYVGSDTTHIVCHPTCHHARRVMDRHKVTFRSLGQAAESGYRPCKICRPVAVAA